MYWRTRRKSTDDELDPQKPNIILANDTQDMEHHSVIGLVVKFSVAIRAASGSPGFDSQITHRNDPSDEGAILLLRGMQNPFCCSMGNFLYARTERCWSVEETGDLTAPISSHQRRSPYTSFEPSDSRKFCPEHISQVERRTWLAHDQASLRI